MDIYVYSDESGVFDKAHNDIFVFGGIMLLSKEERDICTRKYSSVEKLIRNIEGFSKSKEVKATTITNKNKGKLYRSLNQIHKFGVIINIKRNEENVFGCKKTKQRYLDYAYKICVKRKFQDLIYSGNISPNEVHNLYFYIDEHSTATNGRYELREGLEQEFKYGTHNWNYQTFYPPIFNNMGNVQLQFCNSSSTILVRAADIVANRIFFKANQDSLGDGHYGQNGKLYISNLP